MEAVIHPGHARYRKVSQVSLPSRETEIAAFGSVNRQMEAAGDEPSRIRALGRNHDLWSLMVKDLSLDANRLPGALKAQLIELGLWSMRYSTLAILRKLPVTPLIEVNRNIAEGLAQQSAPGQLAPPQANAADGSAPA